MSQPFHCAYCKSIIELLIKFIFRESMFLITMSLISFLMTFKTTSYPNTSIELLHGAK